jgi:streptomycin 6-kinase
VNALGMSVGRSALDALFTRHGLTVEADLGRQRSAPVFAVRDRDGNRLVVKEAGRRYGGSEHAWLAAHADHNGVVDVIDELGGLLLLRGVSGPTLTEHPLGAGHHARAAGELLASLDRRPAAGAATLSRRILAAARRLPPAASGNLQRCHEELTVALAGGQRREWTYLHADFHPRNVILSSHGLVAIDPFGLAGPPAWDLAQFAALAYGGAQREEPPALTHAEILTELVAGFGRAPALLDEMAVYWLMLVHRARQKRGQAPSAWIDAALDEHSRRAPNRCRAAGRGRLGRHGAPRAGSRRSVDPGSNSHVTPTLRA